jgi:glycerophosphoryl diester phosphodiesterase
VTENTTGAFRRAAADGADGVELDVLLCATGEVVVFHDDDLVRLGGRPDRVDTLALGALREITLSGGGGIPTLAEAFEACGPALLVNVELKTQGLGDPGIPRLVGAVADVIDRLAVGARVMVSSFNPLAVGLWKLRRPAVPAALLFEREAPRPLRQAWALPLLRPAAVHPEHALCDQRTIARWHERGYMVSCWTVDDPARLRALARAGIDGVITNDPAAARRALTSSG